MSNPIQFNHTVTQTGSRLNVEGVNDRTGEKKQGIRVLKGLELKMHKLAGKAAQITANGTVYNVNKNSYTKYLERNATELKSVSYLERNATELKNVSELDQIKILTTQVTQLKEEATGLKNLKTDLLKKLKAVQNVLQTAVKTIDAQAARISELEEPIRAHAATKILALVRGYQAREALKREASSLELIQGINHNIGQAYKPASIPAMLQIVPYGNASTQKLQAATDQVGEKFTNTFTKFLAGKTKSMSLEEAHLHVKDMWERLQNSTVAHLQAYSSTASGHAVYASDAFTIKADDDATTVFEKNMLQDEYKKLNIPSFVADFVKELAAIHGNNTNTLHTVINTMFEPVQDNLDRQAAAFDAKEKAAISTRAFSNQQEFKTVKSTRLEQFKAKVSSLATSTWNKIPARKDQRKIVFSAAALAGLAYIAMHQFPAQNPAETAGNPHFNSTFNGPKCDVPMQCAGGIPSSTWGEKAQEVGDFIYNSLPTMPNINLFANDAYADTVPAGNNSYSFSGNFSNSSHTGTAGGTSTVF